MYTLDRAEAHWILTGYGLDEATADRVLTAMEIRGIVWTSESLQEWRHHTPEVLTNPPASPI